MAIDLIYSGNTVPGQVIELSNNASPNGIYFIQNESLDEFDVYPWGVFLMTVFVPFPIAKYSTIFSLDLYTYSYALFEPFPRPGFPAVVLRFYSGARSKVFPFSLYQET